MFWDWREGCSSRRPELIPSTHVGQLTSICNSSFRKPDALLACVSTVLIHMPTHRYTHNLKNLKTKLISPLSFTYPFISHYYTPYVIMLLSFKDNPASLVVMSLRTSSWYIIELSAVFTSLDQSLQFPRSFVINTLALKAPALGCVQDCSQVLCIKY